MRALITLSFIVFTFISCSKDDSPQEDTNETPTGLKLIQEKGFTVEDGEEKVTQLSNYTYYGNDKLKEVKNTTENGVFISTYNHTVNSIKVEYSNGGYWEFTREGNLIVSSALYSEDDDQYPTRFKYEYNSDDVLISREEIQGENFSCFVYYANNEDSNHGTIEDNCNGIRYKNEFDTSKNPNYTLGIDAIIKSAGTSKNNEKKIDIFNGGTNSIVHSYSYTYNEENYPIERKLYRGDKLIARTEYTYE